MAKRIAQLYAEIGTDTTKLKSGLGGARQEIAGFGSEMRKSLGVPIPLTIGAGIAAIGMAAFKAANEFKNYAFQVQDFASRIGATPEEASKFIQVADDVRVSVGELETALKAAIMRGYRPTIQGLGEMADAYNAIEDPIARSKFLLDTFGRSGDQMRRVMELGGQAIEDMGKKIEGTGLLMTKEGIAKAKLYWEEMDQLNDTWTALKNNAGEVTLPIIIKVVDAANKVIGDPEGFIVGLANSWNKLTGNEGKLNVDTAAFSFQTKLNDALRQGIILQDEYNKLMSPAKDEGKGGFLRDWQDADRLQYYADAQEYLNKKTKEYELGLRYLGTVLPETTDLIERQGEKSDETQEKVEGLTHSIEWLSEKETAAAQAAYAMLRPLEKLNDLDMNVGSWGLDQLARLDWKAMGGEALNSYAANLEKAKGFLSDEGFRTGLLALSAASTAMKVAAGETTVWQALKDLQDAGGLTEEQLAKVKEQMQKIKEIGSVDLQWFIDLYFNIHQTGSAPGGGRWSLDNPNPKWPKPEQHGGPVYNRQAYWVGEAGPELFIPNTPGKILPHGESMSATGGDTYIINNYNEKAAALNFAMLQVQKKTRLNASMGV